MQGGLPWLHVKATPSIFFCRSYGVVLVKKLFSKKNYVFKNIYTPTYIKAKYNLFSMLINRTLKNNRSEIIVLGTHPGATLSFLGWCLTLICHWHSPEECIFLSVWPYYFQLFYIIAEIFFLKFYG